MLLLLHLIVITTCYEQIWARGCSKAKSEEKPSVSAQSKNEKF